MKPRGFPPPGRLGEDLAAKFLQARGYRILERNYRRGRKEIDLIAQKGKLVVFVEVKLRTSLAFGPPALAVTPLKQRQIGQVAQAYVKGLRGRDLTYRFDVIAITVTSPTPQIEHLEDAFRL